MNPARKFVLAFVIALAAALAARSADIEKYLPDASEGVVTVNVKQLLTAELVKTLGLDKLVAGDAEARKVLDQLGLDPLKDVDQLAVSLAGNEDGLLVVVQGRFDLARFTARAEKAAQEQKDHLEIHASDLGKIYEVKNISTLVEIPDPIGGLVKDRSVFVVLADKNYVVMTPSKAAATEALEKAAGKRTTKFKSKELGALLAKADPKQTMAVALASGPLAGDKIKSITGGLTLSGGLAIDVVVTAQDADGAGAVNEEIKTQLERAQAITSAIAPLKDVLDAITVEVKDRSISVKGTVKAETLDKLAKVLATLAGQGG